MNQQDAPRFFELLDLTYDMIGVGPAKVISPAAKAMFFQDLERYPLDLIEASLAAHRQDPERGRFTPKVSDITYQIERRRKVAWLSADEAWSRAPKIENQPAVMTLEVAQALAAAQPLIAAGDTVAARMAFKGCYDRLVERAKVERRGPEYFVSPGGSREDEQAVRDEGVRMGMLPPPKAEPVLQLETTVRTPGAKPDLKALLLTLKPKELIPLRESDYE